MVVAKRTKNLRDILVHSLYDPGRGTIPTGATGSGFYPCGLCKACGNHIKTKTFSNFNGTKTFTIRKRITCASRGVVYHATCPCNKVYIGLTTRELKIRMLEHCRDIMNAKTAQEVSTLKTIPRHFRQYHQCNPHGLKIKGIDLVSLGIRGGNIGKVLAQMESRWIYRLGTIAPQGLNESFGFGSFFKFLLRGGGPSDVDLQAPAEFQEQASAAEEEDSLDDSQPLSGQGNLQDEVVGKEEEDEEDDGDEYFLNEEASPGPIETGGFARPG
ncbi:unnamed protein product [Ranitomeya imitator]|uniref:GIY-YIG domain-containing protein n=1 Tax=Ranitomeya imitator TaxID=111125 RepID=A0ABN9MNI0_9NEOB|nr:unnamed protein product [Ranitomeya imitator]